MIPISKEFEEALKNDNRDYILKADITLGNGTKISIFGNDFWDSGMSFEESTSSSNSFDIGMAVIGKCTIVLNNIYDKFSRYDFTDAVVVPYIGLKLSATTEFVRKGFYTVDSTKYNGSLITLECLDNMWKLDAPYSEVKTSYPATLSVIIADICLYCGVSLGNANFDNYHYTIKKRPDDKNINCREVLSYVAQICACYAKIGTNGALYLKWYSIIRAGNASGGIFDKNNPYTTGDDLYGGNFTDYSSGDSFYGGTFKELEETHYITSTNSFDVGTDDIKITGIRLLDESEDDGYNVLCGTDEYVLALTGNAFINKDNASEICAYIGSKIVGMIIRPFNASILSFPSIESGDTAIIMDFRENSYQVYITSVGWTVGGYENVSCGVESPNRKKTVRYSESVKTAAQIKKDTQNQISEYDKIVQNMNQLATNALGYHESYETLPDGSRISYTHDKPKLSDSKIVYKRSIDGFFISTDGGKTYTAGFDSNGNAVLNIIAAVGIVCDWIKGGTLSLGGSNNADGVCVVYDANGDVMARLDKDGLMTHSADIRGGKIDIYTDDSEANSITLRSGASYLNLFPSKITCGASGVYTVYTWDGVFFNSLSYFHSNVLKIYDTEIRNGTIKIGKNVSIAPTVSDISGWKLFNGSLTSLDGYYSMANTSAHFKRQFYADSGINVTGGIYMPSGNIQGFYSNIDVSKVTTKSLYVNGTKSRIATTKNYSDRLLYCYEMPKPYFGDIGEARLDRDGICYVFIDDIFYETINTDCKYQVFLQKYGKGDLWVEERTSAFFVVKGAPNLPFGWEIKAKQLGFEMERLDKFNGDELDESIDYEKEAQNYVENFYREALNYEH